MANINKETRLQTIDEMISLLTEFRRKKNDILPGADFFDAQKAENYNNIIEWINTFSKKLNIDLLVTIRKESPVVRVRFFEKKCSDEITDMIKQTQCSSSSLKSITDKSGTVVFENNKESEKERTFEFIVGSANMLKIYDYVDLKQGMFLDYKQKAKQVCGSDFYDNILNLMPSIADNAANIKNCILDAAEKELFKQIKEEDKELEKLIRVFKK